MILALVWYCCNIQSTMALLDVTLLQASDADMSNDAPAGEEIVIGVALAGAAFLFAHGQAVIGKHFFLLLSGKENL